MQWVYGAITIAVTLAIALPAVVRYLNNADLVRATVRDAEEVARLDRTPGRTAAQASESLDLLLERVDLLEKAKARFAIPGWWGMQAATPLHEPMRALYVKRLRSDIEGPVRDQLKSDVKAIGESLRNDSDNFLSSYDSLKLYVMLTAPEHLDVEWAGPKLADKWGRALKSDAKRDAERLAAHARYYVSALAADKTWTWPADESILARARAKLSRQPLEELQYGWLVGNAEGVPPIRPEKIFYGPSSQFVTLRANDVQVLGAYTAAGWEKVRAALDSSSSRLVIEPWVLGGATQATGNTRDTSAERLRDMYFQRYERAWLDFLNGLVVQPPPDVRTAIAELEALSEADGPYTRLFRALSENAKLDLEPTSLVGKALEKGKDLAAGAVDKLRDAAPEERNVSPVERRFKPLVRFAFGEGAAGKGEAAPSGLSQYLVQLTNLAVSLRQLSESKSEPTNEFAAELSRTAAAVERLLGGFDTGTRLLLEPFLMNPIRGSRAGVVSSGNTYLSDKWKAEVWEIWNGKLAGRYPFTETAEEVSLPEFIEFFRPQTGIIWKFYGKNLADRLDQTGATFAPKAAADPMPFRPDFLRCLGHAQEITDAVLGAGPDAAVPFTLKMQSVGPNVSEVTFRVDGQASVYRNEPERWLSSLWPGKGTPHGAVLLVKGAGFTDEIPRNGDFGLFRLLAAGGIKSAGAGSGDGVLVATWTLTRQGEPPVTIQFKPAKSAHPFARDFFRRMKCPAEVMAGSAPAPPGRGP
jgi:type VI secretion system protein ImpL